MSALALAVSALILSLLCLTVVLVRLRMDDVGEVDITDDDYTGDRHPSALPRDFHGSSEDFT
jgi:hypothetical protein